MKKIITPYYALCILLILPILAWAAYSRTWNSAYELSPADGDNVSEGAGKIRNLKTDIRERLAKDHYFDVSGTDADHGEHKWVTLREQSSAPSNVSDKGFVYTLDDGAGVTELYYKDSAGDYVKLTKNGKLNASALSTDGGIPAAAIGADTIALGTKTTGNYLASVSAGTGIDVSGSDGEGATKSISINSSYQQKKLSDLGASYVDYSAGTTIYAPSTSGYYFYMVFRYNPSVGYADMYKAGITTQSSILVDAANNSYGARLVCLRVQ